MNKMILLAEKISMKVNQKEMVKSILKFKIQLNSLKPSSDDPALIDQSPIR